MESATQTGVQDGEVNEVEFNKAPLKSVYDLDDEHPMKKRALAMDAAEAKRMAEFEAESGIPAPKEETDNEKTDASTTAGDTPEKAEPAKADADLDKQIEAQDDELIFTPEMIARAKVMTKVDGVDELVPASKVLSQYQKGAAADQRLAEATRVREQSIKDAAAIVEKAQKDAQERTATAATPTEKAEAQSQVQSAVAAKAKFKEAADALFEGDSERAATLFSEAQTLAQPPAPVVSADPEAMTRQITANVEQNLSQKSALSTLRTDYPEIFADRDFALLTDAAYNAHVSNGKLPAEALLVAGEQVAEKFKLGKFASKPGRTVKSAAPTTIAEKLEGKKDLDNVRGDDARATSNVEQPKSASDIIAEIANSRPGARQV